MHIMGLLQTYRDNPLAIRTAIAERGLGRIASGGGYIDIPRDEMIRRISADLAARPRADQPDGPEDNDDHDDDDDDTVSTSPKPEPKDDKKKPAKAKKKAKAKKAKAKKAKASVTSMAAWAARRVARIDRPTAKVEQPKTQSDEYFSRVFGIARSQAEIDGAQAAAFLKAHPFEAPPAPAPKSLAKARRIADEAREQALKSVWGDLPRQNGGTK